MLRVAKGTAQVAAAKAHEDGRRSSMVAFALQGVEYFVDFVHSFLALRQAQGPAVVEPVETPLASSSVLSTVSVLTLEDPSA